MFTAITGIAVIFPYGVSLPAAYGYVTFMKVERSAYLHVLINYLYSIYVICAVAHLPLWLAGWNAIRGAGSRRDRRRATQRPIATLSLSRPASSRSRSWRPSGCRSVMR